MEGLRKKRLILPSLERPKTLPVVLSKEDRTAEADAPLAENPKTFETSFGYWHVVWLWITML
jgi:hypothetical protein